MKFIYSIYLLLIVLISNMNGQITTCGDYSTLQRINFNDLRLDSFCFDFKPTYPFYFKDTLVTELESLLRPISRCENIINDSVNFDYLLFFGYVSFVSTSEIFGYTLTIDTLNKKITQTVNIKVTDGASPSKNNYHSIFPKKYADYSFKNVINFWNGTFMEGIVEPTFEINKSICPGQSYGGFSKPGTYYYSTTEVDKNMDYDTIIKLTLDYNNTGNMTTPEQDHEITIYPNPAYTEIYIDTNIKRILEIEIADLNGRKILKKAIHHETKTNINIESLANGIYFCKIIAENSDIFWKKIVVKS